MYASPASPLPHSQTTAANARPIVNQTTFCATSERTDGSSARRRASTTSTAKRLATIAARAAHWVTDRPCHGPRPAACALAVPGSGRARSGWLAGRWQVQRGIGDRDGRCVERVARGACPGRRGRDVARGPRAGARRAGRGKGRTRAAPACRVRPPLGAVENHAGFPTLVLGSSTPNRIVDVRAVPARPVPAEWRVQAGGDEPAGAGAAGPASPDVRRRGPGAGDRRAGAGPRARADYGGDAQRPLRRQAPTAAGRGAVVYDLGAGPSRPARRHRPLPAGRVWGRCAAGAVIVSTAHSRFAAESARPPPRSGLSPWRTRGCAGRAARLVANAGTFVITTACIRHGLRLHRRARPPGAARREDGPRGRRPRRPVSRAGVHRVAAGRAARVRTYDHDLVVRLGRG